jgi:hypothetical protein
MMFDLCPSRLVRDMMLRFVTAVFHWGVVGE